MSSTESSSAGLRVVVMWPRFGPYHLARLEAAERLFTENGCMLYALETAGSDTTYAWKSVESKNIRRTTLFPTDDYMTLSPGKIRSRTAAALSRIDPNAVAVCGWSMPEAREAIVWCRLNRRAVVLMSDSKADDSPRRLHLEAIKKRIAALCDAALVAGAPHRDYVLQLGMAAACIFMGYDTIDNAHFALPAETMATRAEIRRRLGIGTREYILASNRFIERKNLPALVRAYARYRTQAGDDAWDLVLLGDGPGRAEIELQVEAARVQGVYLPGFRQIDELPHYYSNAACFIHPALQDQWGLVVNEAMAAGLPVLVSWAAGCRYDLVEEGKNGFIFDPTSTKAMAEAMLKIHRTPPDDRLAMGHRSREIITNWGPNRFADELWKAVCAGLAGVVERTGKLSLIDRLILKVK